MLLIENWFGGTFLFVGKILNGFPGCMLAHEVKFMRGGVVANTDLRHIFFDEKKFKVDVIYFNHNQNLIQPRIFSTFCMINRTIGRILSLNEKVSKG